MKETKIIIKVNAIFTEDTVKSKLIMSNKKIF